MGATQRDVLLLFRGGRADYRILSPYHSPCLQHERAGSAVSAGGLPGFSLINRLIHAYVCDKTPETAIGLIPLLGIGLHSMLDGVVYAITVSVSILTGTLAAIGMVLHEFP